MIADEQKKEKALKHFASLNPKIKQMSHRELEHLREAAAIKDYVSDIERSKQVDIPFLLNSHRYLRMRYRWYYRWHLDRRANGLHYLALIVFLAAIVVEFVITMGK